jgi:transcriptional regulator with PAS, ATPase and Fis domain
LEHLDGAADEIGRLLERRESPDDELDRLRRLDAVERLVPAFFHVLDVREIFGRLSAITNDVVAHEFASMVLFNDALTEVTLYAGTSVMAALQYTGPMTYPPAQTAAWLCRLVPDMREHPLDRTNDFSARAGARGSIRAVIQLDQRTIGVVAFSSRQPNCYTALDLVVARRVADYVALALSHQRAAEKAQRAAVLEERNAKLEMHVRALSDELDSRTGYRRMAGDSKAWRQVLTEATKVSATDTTALLLGESGTGKEVVARFVHRASPRSNGPFVAMNCAALPEQLLEAELFGYERGAYTGATSSKPGQLEQAAGGTLFLDEVGEMSLPVQAKFLRVLQEREFQRLGGTRVLRSDARIVAATNRDLERAIAQGQFREDLYYRLNVFAIQLPALRERRDDILPLCEAFLAELSQQFGHPPAGVSQEARRLLLEYHWPGNVRELRNSLERAAILCEGGLITPEHLPVKVTQHRSDPPSAAAVEPAVAEPASHLPSVERLLIEQALQKTRFNKTKAAKALGLTRQQLYVRMRKYGLL